MTRRAEVALLMAVVTVVAIGILATQPRESFWGPDSGNRFLQLRNILRTGGIAFDAAPGHHFVSVGDDVYSFYSPAFPIVTAPLYAWFGSWGLFILPILGTLAILASMSRLIERDYLVVAGAAVFATPLLWYTVVYWEHTCAVALALSPPMCS